MGDGKRHGGGVLRGEKRDGWGKRGEVVVMMVVVVVVVVVSVEA